MAANAFDQFDSQSANAFDQFDAKQGDGRTKYEDPIPSIPFGDLAAGAVRGAGSIGATILAPWDIGKDLAAGKGLSLESNRERRQQIDEGLRLMGADPDSTAYGLGKFGAEVAGTLGAGGAVAGGVRMVPGLSRLATAIETMGGTAGTGGATVANAANRVAGGAIAGGAMSGLSDPEQVGMGALIGGGIPILGQAIGQGAKGVGWLHDLVKKNLGNVKAGQIGREAAGENLAAIRAANEAADPGLTAGQAAYGINQDPYQAMARFAEKNDASTFYRPLKEGQQTVRANAMAEMAQGGTAQDAALARDLYSKLTALDLKPVERDILNKLAEPGRQLNDILPVLQTLERRYVSALQNQGVMATEAGQQGVLATGERATDSQLIRNLPAGNFTRDSSIVQPTGLPRGAYPVPGQPRVPPRYAPNVGPQEQMASAADELGGIAAGLRPEADALRQKISELPSTFTAGPVRSAIGSMLASPVVQQNTAKVSILDALSKKLAIAGDDPVAIAELRKVGVNELIGDLIQTGKVSKGDAAAALDSAKKLIDKQLGSDYVSKYLEPYSKALAERDSLRLVDSLRQMQVDQPKKFMKVLRGDDPKLVAQYGNWKTIQEALGSERFGKASGIAGEMIRDRALKIQAQSGLEAFGNIIRKDEAMPTLPGFLSIAASSANKAITLLENKVNRETLNAIVEGMKSGASANQLLSVVPANERNAVAMAITKSGYNPAIGATATSAQRQ